jgi:hypothetical protein
MVLFVLTVSACTKEIDLKVKNFAPQLVVNSILMEDSIIRIHLSKTQKITATSDILNVEDAVVQLYSNGGQFMGGMNYDGNGYYSHTLTAVPEMDYKIEIYTDDLECEARDTVPKTIVINSVDTANTLFIEGKNFFQITMSFEDDVSAKNYYSIRAELLVKEYIMNGSVKEDSTYSARRVNFLTDDVYILSNKDNQIFKEELLFTDIGFNGLSTTVKFGTYDIRDLASNEVPMEMTLFARSVSHSSYRYFNTLNAHLYYQDDPFSLPVEVFSNVEDGRGIFGSVSEKKMIISFD